MSAIFAEAAKFSENVPVPINASGDEEGCKWLDVKAQRLKVLKKLIKRMLRADGQECLTQEFGGQALPYSLSSIIAEWFSGANHSWAMFCLSQAVWQQ